MIVWSFSRYKMALETVFPKVRNVLPIFLFCDFNHAFIKFTTDILKMHFIRILCNQGEQITGHHFREWWRQAVPKLLSPLPSMDYLNPTAHLEEDLIRKELLEPLEKFLCGIPDKTSHDDVGTSPTTPEQVLEYISSMNDPPSQCGKMFR